MTDPQPFKFKVYPDAHDPESFFEGGAESKVLCLDYLQKLKRDNPEYVCCYMGHHLRRHRPFTKAKKVF